MRDPCIAPASQDSLGVLQGVSSTAGELHGSRAPPRKSAWRRWLRAAANIQRSLRRALTWALA